MNIKRFILRASVSAAFVMPITSHAGGIMGDLTQLFMSNSTASGVIKTPDRTGVFGGSVIARAPITPINWVSFDPPRFDAGCGGIDLYGGSFSFINGTQITQIFRNVAASAAGLAFRAAIKAISPSLDGLISDFQGLMQNLNNLSKNSCQLAHLATGKIDEVLGTSINGDGNTAAVHKSVFDDSIAALDGWVKSGSAALKKLAANDSKSGNGLVKAVIASGAGGVMGLSSVPNFDGSPENASDPNSLNNRILISLLGYEVIGVPCQQYNEMGSTNTTTADPAAVGTIVCKGAPILEFEDLVKGGGTGSASPSVPLKLYYCANPSGIITSGTDPQICTDMQRQDFNYPGIRGWVNTVLFGNALGDTTAITPTSIVGAFNTGGSASLTSAQVKFIQTSKVPLIALFARTATPDQRVAFAERLREHIVDCMAAGFGEAIFKSALLIKGSESGYTISGDIAKRIDDNLRTEYQAKRESCQRDLTVLNIVTEVNQATRWAAHSNR